MTIALDHLFVPAKDRRAGTAAASSTGANPAAMSGKR
jgi:hypothetical protein